VVTRAVDLEGAQDGGADAALGGRTLQQERACGLRGAEEAAGLEGRVLRERAR
jgi:hypothetical protein